MDVSFSARSVVGLLSPKRNAELFDLDRSFLISHLLLALPNLLFDRTNNRLSAVLDFDLAHIGAPLSEEYLFSFWDLDGRLSESSDPIDPLCNYILEVFPFLEEVEEVETCSSMGQCFTDVGAKQPSTINKGGDVADI